MMESPRPSVRLLVQAYTAMLQQKSLQKSSTQVRSSSPSSHMFYDRLAARKYKSRNRHYRQSPNDKRWLTWDASDDPLKPIWLREVYEKTGRKESTIETRKTSTEDVDGCSRLGLIDTTVDDGCHSDFSPSPTWSGNVLIGSNEESGRPSRSRAGSTEDFLKKMDRRRSSSCSLLVDHVSRSLSQDSAVELESFASMSLKRNNSPSSDIEMSRSEYTEQWNSVASTVRRRTSDTSDIVADAPCGNRKCSDPICVDDDGSNGNNSKKQSQSRMIPPSVVISDYSGDTVSLRVALLNDDFKLSSLSLPGRGTSMSFVTEPLCELGLSVSKVCPRKVSDCSTCSSVSTVDMSPDSHLALDELVPPSRRSSCCSNCSAYTAPDVIVEKVALTPLDEVPLETTQSEQPHLLPLYQDQDQQTSDDQDSSSAKSEKTSNWRKVKNVVQWTPFIQTYKRHKYPWVQLAGHQGNFKAGEKQGTILKKLCPAEQRALEGLMQDVLKPYVPEYMGMVESGSDQEQFLQLQDLLSDFTAPCVMDIKMGVRTYLEDELAKAREKPKLRKDMYEKMIQIDPAAPSEAEQRAQAVTKPRYMVWRETISSTATLGFRIEGVKKSDGSSSKDFKTTRSQDQVLTALSSFVSGYGHAPAQYVKRLKEIRAALEASKFFMSHELIGSSLLFVHNENQAVVWLIDFAKSIPLPTGVNITHRAPWVEGSHEDGYLLGLDNLISLMTKLDQSLKNPETSVPASSSSSNTVPSSATNTPPPKPPDDQAGGIETKSSKESSQKDGAPDRCKPESEKPSINFKSSSSPPSEPPRRKESGDEESPRRDDTPRSNQQSQKNTTITSSTPPDAITITTQSTKNLSLEADDDKSRSQGSPQSDNVPLQTKDTPSTKPVDTPPKKINLKGGNISSTNTTTSTDIITDLVSNPPESNSIS